MEPVKEEHYKRQIREAMMQSYEVKPALEAQPCGSLNQEKFVDKMIEIMRAYKLENKTDWAGWYDNLTPSHEKIPIIPCEPPSGAFCYKTVILPPIPEHRRKYRTDHGDY